MRDARFYLLVVLMTAAEAGAVVYWMMELIAVKGDGGVYAFPAVVAGGVLLAGLVVEDLVETGINKGWRELNPWETVGLGVTEVIMWTQWGNIVLLGLWSAEGIGPAYVVLAGLLTLQHSVETAVSYGETPFQIRHAITAVAESAAATVGWVFLLEGAFVPAAIGVFALILVEHGYRMSDLSEKGILPH